MVKRLKTAYGQGTIGPETKLPPPVVITVIVYDAVWVSPTAGFKVPSMVAVEPVGIGFAPVDAVTVVTEATVFPFASLSIKPETVASLLPVLLTITERLVAEPGVVD